MCVNKSIYYAKKKKRCTAYDEQKCRITDNIKFKINYHKCKHIVLYATNKVLEW